MTHKFVRKLPSQGWSTVSHSRLKKRAKNIAKSDSLVLNYCIHDTLCYTKRQALFDPYCNSGCTPYPSFLPTENMTPRSERLLSKKVEKIILNRPVDFCHYFSLFTTTEECGNRSLAEAIFLSEMAYSLTPYFITLQNVVL